MTKRRAFGDERARLPRPSADLTVASTLICGALPKPACACAVAVSAPLASVPLLDSRPVPFVAVARPAPSRPACARALVPTQMHACPYA